MENINKKWTHEEHEILKENYPTKGLKYCSETLKRSKKSVYAKIRKLKLKCTNKDLKRNVKYTKELVENAVKNALCLSDVIRNLGLIPQAGNYDNIKNRINEYKIDTSHFLSQGEITKIRLKERKRNYFEQKPLSEILIISLVRPDHRKLKNRLYNEKIKKEQCELCGQGPIWMGKEISLRLDHINGNNKDYRIENLRIICPNCDATLETYCSNNRKNKTDNKKEIRLENRICVQCKNIFKPNNKKAKYCSQKCRRKFNYKSKPRKRKVERPDIEQLILEVKAQGFSAVGRKYGVSDNAIRKWIKTK